MIIQDKCTPIKLIKAPKNTSKNIKECLSPEELDPIEVLKQEIRNILIQKGNKNDEIGKPRYIRPNLPDHIDPVHYRFGKACKDRTTTASEVITGERIHYIDVDSKFERVPGEQTTRNYKEPFDKNAKFGKAFNADVYGNRLKNLLFWYKGSEDCSKDTPEVCYSRQLPVTPKEMDPNYEGVSKIIKECPFDLSAVTKRKLCLAHLNLLRRQIKKRDDVDFLKIREHFYCLNNKKREPDDFLVNLDLFYDVLKLVRINPDKKLFQCILNDLDLITEDCRVHFEEALSLLNWRCPFPRLSKIHDLPEECTQFDTVYKGSMRSCEEVECGQKMWCVRQEPVPSKDLDPIRVSVSKTLKECPTDPTAFKKKLSVAHLNRLRLQIRKRKNKVDFSELRKIFKKINLGKECVKLVTLDTFYEVLLTVRINPDRELLEYILRDLHLISENCETNYDEALKVLDPRYNYPCLSFIQDLPKECLCYETTYNKLMVPHKVKPLGLVPKREDTICLSGYK